MSIFDEEFKKKKKYPPKEKPEKKPRVYKAKTEVYLYGKNLKEALEGKKK